MGKFIHLFNTEAEYETKRETGYTEPWVSYTRETSAVTYNKDEHEKLLKMPLTFEILSNGNITWSFNDEGAWEDAEATIQYKKNDGEWTNMPRTLSVNVGDVVEFRGDNTTYGSWEEVFNTFGEGTTAGFNVKGNIMSLIESTGFDTATTLATNYTFTSIFRNCTGLTSAENLVLPATTLTENCYYCMFDSCTSLTTAPALPATILALGCYDGMFYRCTSLASAPALPATTLADNCYQSMFAGCISLTIAPATLPATTLAGDCYNSMFSGCTSLTSAPVLPATTLVDSCYASMFRGCTSLTSAPELPATTLADSCYGYMFRGCTNLNYIKCLATDISADSCAFEWVYGVSSTGTFVKDASMTDWTTGEDGIPANWTVQDA